ALVTFLVQAHVGEAAAVARTVASLARQTSGAWQCLISVPTGKAWLDESRADSRVVMLVGPDEVNGPPLSELAQAAATPFIAVLDPGDRVAATAVEENAEKLDPKPELGNLYPDEDRVTGQGERSEPSFKPGWSPELLRAYNYFGRLVVLRRSLVEEVGGFEQDLAHASEWDLNLRVTEVSDHIDRITQVLCHRGPQIPNDRPGPKDEASALFREVLRRYWSRQGVSAAIETLSNGTQRATWAIESPPLVSIVIPNKNKPDLLRACVEGLLHGTSYPRREIIIVDNDSTDPGTLAIYGELRASESARIVPFLEPFNFSAACNVGARAASGELL